MSPFLQKKKRKDVTYAVRNWVNLKLWYKPKSLAKKINDKLSPRFYGPYHITKVIWHVAYQLDLSSESKIHSVSHVPLLKKDATSGQSSAFAKHVV